VARMGYHRAVASSKYSILENTGII